MAIIILSGLSIYQILSPKTQEEQIALYSYSMTVDSGYKVYLKENEFISDIVMEENMLYPQGIFDKLEINFYSKFLIIDTEADIDTNYSIDVAVRGYQTIENEKKIAYEKIFPITTKTNISSSNEAVISEKIFLDFTEYEAYVSNVETLINANPNREAEIIFSGKFKAQTEFEDKEESFTYSIPLPLLEKLFVINKPAPIEKFETIEKTEVHEVQTDRTMLTIPIVIIVIMLILCIYILFFTVEPTKEEMRILKFKEIKRRHGSRIVKASQTTGFSYETTIVIKDIESMIKICDEQNLPILYIPNEEGMPQENTMYILGDNIQYIYYID